MWVIPKNLQASSGLLAGLETIKDSAELSQICAASLFVRGKDTQSATWLRRWKKAGWHQRLSGRIAAHSPSNRSLIEGWISSLLPIRARENLSLVTSSAPKILDSYGRIVESSLQQFDLFTAFSRMSEDTSISRWSKSSATWLDFSTQLSQEYSARKSAAAAIRGNGFSSSQRTWPTPQANKTTESGELIDSAGRPFKGIGKPHSATTGRPVTTALADAASLWPTPRTITGGAESAERKQELGRQELGRQESGGGDLQSAVQNWCTPTTGDHKGDRHGELRYGTLEQETYDQRLRNQAATWSTPRASDGEKGGPNMSFGAGGVPLPSQAAKWPTPNLQDSEQAGSPNAGHLTLNRSAVVKWPTPSTRDYKGSNSEEHCFEVGTGRKHMDQLANYAVHAFRNPLPAPMMPPSGIECFSTDPSSLLPSDGRRLNVFFVEWLMGWPINHTCTNCGACSAKIALIASECSGTECSPIPQLSLG